MSGGTINTNTGNDSIAINGTLSGGTLNMNAGKDSLTVTGNMSSGTVSMGCGVDSISINGSLSGGTITTDDGNDSLSINANMTNGSINMGNGADNLRITGYFNDGAINMGADNDVLSIGKMSNAFGTINLGTGDDTLIFTANNQAINAYGTKGIDGGTGFDILTLSGSGQSLSLSEVMGIEMFDLTGNGNNTLEDLTSSYVKSLGKPVYVKGNAGDVVDLGYNATGANLTEQLGNFGTKWASTGASTTDTDGAAHLYNAWQFGTDTTTLIYIENTINNSNII